MTNAPNNKNSEEKLIKAVETARKNFNNFRTQITKEMENLETSIAAYKKNNNTYKSLKRNPPTIEQTQQRIRKEINWKERIYKNEKATNEYLQGYMPKNTLVSRRKNRIEKGILKKANANFAKEKQQYNAWEASTKQQREALFANLQKREQNFMTKKQRKNALAGIQAQLVGKGYIYGLNPTHEKEELLRAAEKKLDTYRTNKRTAKLAENLNSFISRFARFGFEFSPYKPAVIEREIGGLGRTAEIEPARQAYFFFETKKVLPESNNLSKYANWKQEKRTYEDQLNAQHRFYKETGYHTSSPRIITNYMVTREYPSGYPQEYKDRPIYEAEWNDALAKLEAANPTSV